LAFFNAFEQEIYKQGWAKSNNKIWNAKLFALENVKYAKDANANTKLAQP